jgi:2-C-methyl-D-erythritol 2,4-cyclodiphosphate synthase
MSIPFRIGQGIDTHPLVEGRPLILGGVTIAHTHGLQGHSDADALTHAVCDGLLGALGLGDIGVYFSDTDPAHENRNSLEFLSIVYQDIQDRGWTLGNMDSTIITEAPKLRPHIPAMQQTLAEQMGVLPEQISIKATRPEKMGALGRGEGILVMANVLLVKK